MKKICFLLFSLFIANINAQTLQSFRIKSEGKFKVDPSKPDTSIFIKSIEAPAPDGETARQKTNRLKKINAKKYPRKNISAIINNRNDELSIGYSENANPQHFFVPSDNSMAISDEGMIVSCINSSYYFYDAVANIQLTNGDLLSYSSDPNSNVFDPKVIYDPKQDRFIMVMLKDFSSTSNNQIIIVFSSSNDPLDEWYVYSLTGNPFNATEWSDYPAISITDNELFITANLLGDGESWQDGFRQSIIWQVDKNDGYANQELDVNLWSDITFDTNSFVRNLHPVRNYSNYISFDPTTDIPTSNQYFLSNRNFALESDTIFLIEITGDLNSSPSMNITLLNSSTAYFLPVNGQQSVGELVSNDARILGATFNRQTDIMQFVQTTTDTSTGTAAIYHGIIEGITTTPTCSGNIISDPIKDFGYPNIASTALTSTDNSTMIGFDHTSSSDHPGHTAIHFDSNRVYSNPLIIKTGQNYIDALFGNLERWGDYSGIQRKYNEPGKVWFEGIYGRLNRRYGNWISEIYNENYLLSAPTAVNPNEQSKNKSKVYPNPTDHIIWFNFEMEKTDDMLVDIYDMSGKKVANLFNGKVKAGQNLLSLNTSFLASGAYTLVLIDSNKNKILSKKIIRQ